MEKLGGRGPQHNGAALRWLPLYPGGWRLGEAKPSHRVRGCKEERTETERETGMKRR